MNKTKLVKEHLLTKGRITSWEAIQLYGATRLSGIIYNLKHDGMNIITTWEQGLDRFGNTSRYGVYIYIPDEHIPRID